MLLGDLLVMLLAAGFVWLGRWQWDRAHQPTGGLQNYLYAAQWWLFCGVGIVGWVKTVLQVARTTPSEGGSPGQIDAPRPQRITLPAGYRLPTYPSLPATRAHDLGSGP